jgi:hypothetical protein
MRTLWSSLLMLTVATYADVLQAAKVPNFKLVADQPASPTESTQVGQGTTPPRKNLWYEATARLGYGRTGDLTTVRAVPGEIQYDLGRNGFIAGLAGAVCWRQLLSQLTIDWAGKGADLPNSAGYTAFAQWACTQLKCGYRLDVLPGRLEAEPLLGWGYLYSSAEIKRRGDGTVYKSEKRNRGLVYGGMGQLGLGESASLRSEFTYQRGEVIDSRLTIELLLGSKGRLWARYLSGESYAGVIGWLGAWQSDGRRDGLFFFGILVVGPLD